MMYGVPFLLGKYFPDNSVILKILGKRGNDHANKLGQSNVSSKSRNYDF